MVMKKRDERDRAIKEYYDVQGKEVPSGLKG